MESARAADECAQEMRSATDASTMQEDSAERSAGDNERDFAVQMLPLAGDRPFSDAERIWTDDLCRFYTRNILRDRVAPYTEGKRALSERDMTWAAVNYFAEFPVEVPHPETGYPVFLHIKHAECTEEYGRYLFDPFKRVYKGRTRHIRVVCRDDPSFEIKCTTIAQLNWYRFALRYRFIEACEAQLDAIKTHWNDTQRKRKHARSAELAMTGEKAKRAPLIKKKVHPISGASRVSGTIKIGF